MNIFYYYWNENPASDIIEAFKADGHTILMSDKIIRGYDDIEEADIAFKKYLMGEDAADMIYSFNYFPFLSGLAHKHSIPYVSWVYDCPHLTLYSTTVKNPGNRFYIFDRGLCSLAEKNGAKNVYHLPLAVNKCRLEELLKSEDDYRYDVTFVGSLYSENMYDQVSYLPGYVRGFIDSLISSQQRLWGIDLVSELLNDKIVSGMEKYILIDTDPRYSYTKKDIFTDFITKKICNTERVNLLSKIKGLTLFTGDDCKKYPALQPRGTVDYINEMPRVFHQSKINLNISLRSIRSGIPLRAMDIMGAGGFLLSNYQPELEEYFINGTDYVFFEDEDDMLQKIDHYLSCDDEREAIAKNGQKKVFDNFTYNKAIKNFYEK